jgi:hypothetical protein
MGKRAVLLIPAVTAVAIAGLWAVDVLADRSYSLIVVSDAPLLELGPHEYPLVNHTVAVLHPGEKIQVLRLRYGKDFQAFRVETGAGLQGWVVVGNGVVVKRGEK